MDMPCFVYSPVNWPFRLFSVWSVTSNVAKNICVQAFCGVMFSFLLGKYV